MAQELNQDIHEVSCIFIKKTEFLQSYFYYRGKLYLLFYGSFSTWRAGRCYQVLLLVWPDQNQVL